MSKYNDDEQIEIAEQSSGLVSYFQREGKAKLSRLTGRADVKAERGGLDVVAVLDVGSSMKNEDGKNLKTMQSALRFLIKKLTPDDRLSVVTFTRKAERMCPLRWMTASAQAEIGELVDSFKAEQVLEGLLLGKQVLDGRGLIKGRAPIIMLMTDVEDDMNEDDKSFVDLQIPTTDVPVFTYGFGRNVNMELLLDIAHMSQGGTFSYISREEDLNDAFSFVPELTKPQSEKKLEIKSSADQKGGVKESTEIVETVKSGAKKVFKIMTDAADGQKKSAASVEPDKDANIKSTGFFSKPWMSKTFSGTKTETKSEIKTVSHKKEEPSEVLGSMTEADNSQKQGSHFALSFGAFDDCQSYAATSDTSPDEEAKDGKIALIDATTELNKLLELMTDALDAQKKSSDSSNPDKDVKVESLGSGTPTKTQQGDINLKTTTDSLFATPGLKIYLEKINIPEDSKDQEAVLETPTETPLAGASEKKLELTELPSDKEVGDDPFEPFVKSLGENHQKAIQILKLNDNVFDSDNTVQVKDLENIVANVQIAIQSLRQMQDTDIESLRQLLET